MAGREDVHAVLGGFHPMTATEEQVEGAGRKMQEFGSTRRWAPTATGSSPVQDQRDGGGFDRDEALVGTVGSLFTRERGVGSGLLNR